MSQQPDPHLIPAPEATRKRLQRQITATDHAIDNLVYELYNLTDEEIAVVEGPTEQA